MFIINGLTALQDGVDAGHAKSFSCTEAATVPEQAGGNQPIFFRLSSCFTPLTCGLPLRVTSELRIPSNPPSALLQINSAVTSFL